jgi:hypothetical protein
MFRAVYRSSSWALTVFAASGLHTHVVIGRSQLDYGRSPHAYVNQRMKILLELLMMRGVSLETCWACNERWNNKFCYKVESCWLFLLNHTTMHGSMNIKLKIRLRCYHRAYRQLQLLHKPGGEGAGLHGFKEWLFAPNMQYPFLCPWEFWSSWYGTLKKKSEHIDYDSRAGSSSFFRSWIPHKNFAFHCFLTMHSNLSLL